MTSPKSGARLRAEAAKAIDQVVSHGRSLDIAIAKAAVPERDLPLLRLLSFGTIRHHWRLSRWMRELLNRPLKSRDSVVGALITLGLYQLIDTRVPDHAAVSQTVEATRALRRPQLAPLVNAVLRNFLRSSLREQEPPDDEARFDHPRWLIDRLRQDWPDRWPEILSANNDRAPMWLRVNRKMGTALDYLRTLPAPPEGAPPHELLPGADDAVRLSAPLPVAELPGFAEGRVSVQDAAAQLAAPWLLAGGGRRILDACAAPGGKTGHLLELAGPDAALTAIDTDEERLGQVEENLARLGAHLARLDAHATVLAADASNPRDWWDGDPFDRILVDAPCSATGVIRRHPDIKLLRRESDIDRAAARQAAMLDALWPLLGGGGRLLYVTCSVLRQENAAVIGSFVENQGDAQLVLPNNNIRDLMRQDACGFQILPGERGLDGFFYACLEKTDDTTTNT